MALCLAEAWWLDGVTRQMVEQQLNLGRALTFTLRAGHPIVLTREQVRDMRPAIAWRPNSQHVTRPHMTRAERCYTAHTFIC